MQSILNNFYTLKSHEKSENGSFTANITLNKEHDIFKGHFRNPVTPGVCMMQIVKDLTEKFTGYKLFLKSASNVKFMAIINPFETPDLVIELNINESEDEIKVKNTTTFGETIALKLSVNYKKYSYETDVIIICGICYIFQSSDLEILRDSYAVANLSKENAKNFIEIADKKTSPDPVISAYKAAAKVLEAKVTTDGKRKALVKSGATNLESIIKSNPNNAELRLIRLSVQENVPKIVGYSKNLKEDKEFIISNYSKQNSALKSYIKKFAVQSKTMTAAEKAILK